VELNSSTPGLNVKDAGGTNRVTIKSGSMTDVFNSPEYAGNRGFEESTGVLSPGRNTITTMPSWSLSSGGGAIISQTKRDAYPPKDWAVSGDVTLDVVVPTGAGNYTATPNTYEITQIVTASFIATDTISFNGVSRFSSSFGGAGKDRALQPQYFSVEYSASDGWHKFLPSANYTASNGYGEYFLGSGQYNSFGASAELPVNADYFKITLSGSINDDTGYTIQKPLFVGAKGSVRPELRANTFDKEVKGSTTAEYPDTEISFDNISLRKNTRVVELTDSGLLIFNSENSFLKMTSEGIEYRGGSGVSMMGSAIMSDGFTNDSQVAGTLGAPALQPYLTNPTEIGTVASPGNVGEFSRGNHAHVLPFSTLNTVIGTGTVTSLDVDNLTFGGGGTFSLTGSLAVDSANDSYFIGGGGVGIGTTNTSNLFEVYGGTVSSTGYTTINGNAIIINRNNNAYLYAYGTSNALYLSAGSTGNAVTDARVVIKPDGNVGIGTNNPNRLFHVYSGSAGTDPTWHEDDIAVFESNNEAIIQLFAPTSQVGQFAFSEPGDRYAGGIGFGGSTRTTAWQQSAA